MVALALAFNPGRVRRSMTVLVATSIGNGLRLLFPRDEFLAP